MLSIFFWTPECYESSAPHERQRMRNCIIHQSASIDEGDERTYSAKQVVSLCNVLCDHHLMACSAQRLRNALERRRVGSHDKNQRHYLSGAPPARAQTPLIDTPSVSINAAAVGHEHRSERNHLLL